VVLVHNGTNSIACSYTAARLLVGAKKHDHIKHVLLDRLHWLPVPQRVQFKLCLLTFRALHGLAVSHRVPTDVSRRFVPTSRISRKPTEAAFCHPRPPIMVTRPTSTYFGSRPSAVAGPTAWNLLPADVRSTESVNSNLKLF